MNNSINLDTRDFQTFLMNRRLHDLNERLGHVDSMTMKFANVTPDKLREYASPRGFGFSHSDEDYYDRIICIANEVVFVASIHSAVTTVVITGSKVEVAKVQKDLGELFDPIGSMIKWMVTERDTVEVPLVAKPAIKNAYPFIQGTVEDYIQDYLTSEASVLVLIGPPGTGKTSLIRQILVAGGSGAHLTYDKKILERDSFFGNWLTSDSRFLVLEDADNFLVERKEGNDLMFRFLNLGDGLVSSSDKKIIFSTNLPSISCIDEALVRPGRCFDVLEHREMTREEAKKVVDELGLDVNLQEKESWTLADLTGKIVSKRPRKRQIGFV